MTSSPLPMPNAFKPRKSASVPLPTPITNFAPVLFAKFFSNSLSGLPKVKSPVETKFRKSSHKSSQSENCWGKYEYRTLIINPTLCFACA